MVITSFEKNILKTNNKMIKFKIMQTIYCKLVVIQQLKACTFQLGNAVLVEDLYFLLILNLFLI